MISGGEKDSYDLIVIGGGITGAGVARDAALRGLSTLLIEKEDIASGVTSKSTRLIHGGLRYLANFEIDLVAESLRERSILRRQAPYLIHPMPIMIPIYRGDPHGRAVIAVGIHLYDLLSHEGDIPHYFTSNRERTLLAEPRLNQEGLTGSALFYDHQIPLPERLVVENIISARESGALVKTYTRAVKIEEHDGGITVFAAEAPSGTRLALRAKVLINAAGPWIDQVRKAGGIDRHAVIHPTKGIHLVLPKLTEQALFVTSRDGRMFFIVPWDRYSLIGTTDTYYDGDLDEVHAVRDEVRYLLSESKRILPGLNLTAEHILYTYAGIRPLAFSGSRESKISRKHRVIKEGRAGRIITIAGGKLTTYRNMAKDAVDAACNVLGAKVRCATEAKALPGGLFADYAEYIKEKIPELTSHYGIDPETARHLISLYGARAKRVLDIAREDSDLAEAISPESKDIYAQVAYSVAAEGATTLTDIALRRMHLGITSDRGDRYAERIAEVAGRELKWSTEDKQEQVLRFRDELKKDRMY